MAPPPQPPSPKDLVEDARLIADHGMRSGSLAADAPLFDALANAEAIFATLAWTSPEYGNLQKAMSGAIRAIQPVTMHDLKSGWRIDGGMTKPAGQSEMTWFKGLVLAFTVVLLFFCGSLTNWQQQVKRVVAEFAEDKAQQRHEIRRELFPLMASLTEVQEKERLFDPSIAPRIALFEARHKMELLEGGMLSDLKDAYNLHDDWSREKLQANVSAVTGPVVAWVIDAYRAVTSGDAVAQGKAEPEPIVPVAPATSAIVPPAEDCAAGQSFDVTAEVQKLGTDANVFSIYRAVLAHEDFLIEQIDCLMGFTQARDKAMQSLGGGGAFETPDLTGQLDVIGFWFLPALYGMLGALIYHIRIYLSNQRPDPSRMKVIFRVFLGGFGGVAIGWFWAPDNGELLGVTDITLTTLSLAFLVGFSVDVFLNLLDRLVTVLNGWVGGLGGGSAKPG